jgi:hypothetical protein
MSVRVAFVLLATLLLCVCSSCTRSPNAKNIATVDSLLHLSDSVRAGLGALDHAGLLAMRTAFEERESRVETRLKDTLSKDDALLVGNYRRSMGKVLGKTLKEFDRVVDEVAMCRGQLENLKKDVANSVHTPELEDRYIIEERTALAAAHKRAAGLVIKVQGAFRDDARFRPAVDSILQLHDSLP